jgi:hypothetical protein
MRKQTGVSGVPIDVAPRFIVCGPDKEVAADSAVATLYPATVSNVNPFVGRLEVRVDAHITGNQWYLFSDPTVAPAIEYAYLSGEPGPSVFVRQGFDVDGVETKVRLDFGAGWLDFRAAFKNAGA